MSDAGPGSERLTDYARSQMGRGNYRGAIESLKQVLGLDPDHASAHALLAICLAQTKRLHAAEIEANLALTADPDLPFAHYAAGFVLTNRRKLDRAERHLITAAELAPDETYPLNGLARLYEVTGRTAEAIEALERAQAMDPGDEDVLTDLGRIHLDAGRLDEAERLLRSALEVSPEDARALVAMGHLFLRRRDTKAAREHAIWALRANMQSDDALRLLASIKASENFFTGLWWRWAVWVTARGEHAEIAILLGAFALYRTLDVILDVVDEKQLRTILQVIWYGVVLYSWTAPAAFRRMISKELEDVRLRRGF